MIRNERKTSSFKEKEVKQLNVLKQRRGYIDPVIYCTKKSQTPNIRKQAEVTLIYYIVTLLLEHRTWTDKYHITAL